MHETTLLKIALVCIILGLPALYILSDYFSIDAQVLDRVTGSDIGKHESVSGVVTKVRTGQKLTTLTIKETSFVNVLIFDNLSVPKNSHVIVKGKLVNRTELIADEVRIG